MRSSHVGTARLHVLVKIAASLTSCVIDKGRFERHVAVMADHTSPSAQQAHLTTTQRFWRNRGFARIRHGLTRLRRSSTFLTRMHAAAVRASGGRIRRSFLFTGGMPILVLTTVGRKSGQRRSTPVGYLRYGDAFAVLASNAGSDRVPAWWLNLQAHPIAEVLADRQSHTVKARLSDAAEDRALWSEFARLNPGFDEYRNLTERKLPVVLLEPID
jgi:F420H(2)-dependent quinone reductase